VIEAGEDVTSISDRPAHGWMGGGGNYRAGLKENALAGGNHALSGGTAEREEETTIKGANLERRSAVRGHCTES